MSILINIEDLLSGKIVEGARLELKQGWNPSAIMRSICAFANDFENEGSGYIVLGVEELNGKPIRPVLGFNPDEFEKVQKELIQYCNFIQPSYFPKASLENIDNISVLVIWVPAGSNRPYKVPDDVLNKTSKYNFRIRQFSSTIVPNDEQTAELIQLTAKIPFDDRVNINASIADLNKQLMRQHLEETNSRLYDESENYSVQLLAEKMNLSQGANEHLFPKNVGLLMFSKEPQKYFKNAIIELAYFPEGLSSKTFIEKKFTGVIQQQLIDALSYIKTNVIKEKVVKHPNREKADRYFNYPFSAIEEALSNAVYHKNYEISEPIEVKILPDKIEIISFNGVDPSLKQSDFDSGVIRARRYRNRRIGEFLKDLKLTEGRGTGIPTIINALKLNNSPKPKFETNDPERIFFIAEIDIHPDFLEEFSVQVSDQVSDQVSVEVSDQVVGQVVGQIVDNELVVVYPFDKNIYIIEDNWRDIIQKLSINFNGNSNFDELQTVNTGEFSNKQIAKYKPLYNLLKVEEIQILQFLLSSKSKKEILIDCLGLTNHTKNYKKHLEPLLIKALVKHTIQARLNSQFQKYELTTLGKIMLKLDNKLNKANDL